jgi:putative spermidine/putrescine transport system permease protein
VRPGSATEPAGVRIAVRAGGILVLAFLYVPLVVILLYAFNPVNSQAWPIQGLSMKWFAVAWRNPDVREALANSLKAAAGATTLALVLGSLAAFAVHRFRFFGRETVSFLLVLPLALPGIVTGIALNTTINIGGQLFGVSFSIWTIIVGHATFCIVVVYNNVLARLRRTPGSLAEASMDLGADGWQTFRYVLLPALGTALVAGGLLAFALSFDEIIVTNFTSGTELTLPKFIFNNLRRVPQRPIVNVVAFVIVVASLIPVYVAQRLTQEAGFFTTARRRRERDESGALPPAEAGAAAT